MNDDQKANALRIAAYLENKLSRKKENLLSNSWERMMSSGGSMSRH